MISNNTSCDNCNHKNVCKHTDEASKVMSILNSDANLRSTTFKITMTCPNYSNISFRGNTTKEDLNNGYRL